MRLIKGFLIGIIGLFVAITLLSLLLPSEVKVSRATVINSTINKIYPQLANFKNWKNWQPIFASDSTVIVYSDSTKNELPFCDITYKERQVHINITKLDSTSIKFSLQSQGEDAIANEITLTPVVNNGIQVEWKAMTKLHWYPWDKFYGIFIDKLTGDGYDASLNALKAFVESH